jgi:urease accessory protein
LQVEVGPGARLTVRTAAASIALPGLGPSQVTVEATVAAGATLEWLPEPVVAVEGAVHHMQSMVVIDAGGRLTWREELVLGRHGEGPGSVVTRAHVDLGGAPLLRHELWLGPGHPSAAGPAVTAGARAVGSVFLAGDGCATLEPVVLGPTAAVLPLAGCGAQVVALAGDTISLRRLLDAGIGSALSKTPLCLNDAYHSR